MIIYWEKALILQKKNDLMGTSSYKSLIINYGVVFVFILLISFFLLAYYNIKDKRLLSIYIFLFLGMMYQRPGMLYFPGSFFLLIASVFVIKNNLKVDNLKNSIQNG